MRDYYHATSTRSEQVQMGLDVLDYLTNDYDGFLFLEAPVGTGKSLGTLIPMLRHIQDTSEQILYATATINLQLQLINDESRILNNLNILKDKPLLAVGRDNYACVTKYNSNRFSFDDKNRQILDTFFETSKTGQRFELEKNFNLSLTDSKWAKISLDDIPKSRCNNENCPGHNHRKKYKQKRSITITNQDQLIDSYLKASNNEFAVLNINPGIILIDEAHLLQQNFMQKLDRSSSLQHVLKGLPKTESLNKIVTNIQRKIKNFIDKNNRTTDKISNIYTYENNKSTFLNQLFSDLKKELDSYYVQNINKKNTDKYDDLTNFISLFVEEDQLSWFSIEDRNLHTIPKNFNAKVSEFLWWLRKHNKHVILMSGTLTKNRNSNDILNDWNLENEEDFLHYPYNQTFNYKEQALIYNNKNMPVPKKDNNNHLDKINTEISKFINWPGGILILNSSKEYMDSIYKSILKLDPGRKLFKQGERTVQTITKEFKMYKDSILVASGAFFSGISVPGDALKTLIITKLPFPTPDDPLIRVKSLTRKSKAFIDSPAFLYMIRQLKQGLGRLIRDISDKGVIIILDPRMTNKDYSTKIREILEEDGYIITTNFKDIDDFLNQSYTPLKQVPIKPFMAKMESTVKIWKR